MNCVEQIWSQYKKICDTIEKDKTKCIEIINKYFTDPDNNGDTTDESTILFNDKIDKMGKLKNKYKNNINSTLVIRKGIEQNIDISHFIVNHYKHTKRLNNSKIVYYDCKNHKKWYLVYPCDNALGIYKKKFITNVG